MRRVKGLGFRGCKFDSKAPHRDFGNVCIIDYRLPWGSIPSFPIECEVDIVLACSRTKTTCVVSSSASGGHTPQGCFSGTGVKLA